jgi:DUF1365 family protein
MFDDICIITVKRLNAVTVTDNGKIVHQGRRPVDHNFAQRVYSTMVEKGYEAKQQGNATFFVRPTPG